MCLQFIARRADTGYPLFERSIATVVAVRPAHGQLGQAMPSDERQRVR